MRGRTLFWVVAMASAIVFQTPSTPHPRDDVGSRCPERIAQLSRAVTQGRGPTATFACHGWSAARFAEDTTPADVLVRDAAPHQYEPCEDQYYYRASFLQDAEGVKAVFFFAGGAAAASVLLSADERSMISSADAYASDVQLGTYGSAVVAGGHAHLVCQIDPTYHFYCAASQTVDRLCLTWVPLGRGKGPK